MDIHSPRVCDEKAIHYESNEKRNGYNEAEERIYGISMSTGRTVSRHRYELSEQTSPKHEKHIESPKFKEGILLSRAIQRRRRGREKPAEEERICGGQRKLYRTGTGQRYRSSPYE
jgi:hypothetical protein